MRGVQRRGEIFLRRGYILSVRSFLLSFAFCFLFLPSEKRARLLSLVASQYEKYKENPYPGSERGNAGFSFGVRVVVAAIVVVVVAETIL